jgi:parvulin-like peptidyl-prolyl isomerase
MTERQLKEQKEAKKLKLMTVSFTAVLALILVVAIAFASIQFVANSGIREKNTVALTIGDKELSNAQLNYYFVDSAFEYANTYGAYAAMFGLDLTKPLANQITNEETGATWADEFVTSAINNAKATHALCAEAEANGFTISEEALAQIENAIASFETYAAINGFSGADEYIKAYYGRGASVESFREYSRMNTLAQEYYTYYAESLTYDDAALRAGEEGKEAEFDNYSYHYYFLNTSKFLTGGTTDEEGTVTYSEEEKAAAIAAAEAAAKELAAGEYASVEEFDAAVAGLEINAELETPAKSTACLDYAYSRLTAAAKDWLTANARKAGDVGYVENYSTIPNEDGSENKTINGYYVLYFVERSDNDYALANVRHILIQPEGGNYDAQTGRTTYSAEELATAKAEAEKLLNEWKAGKASEETFIALAKEHNADPGSKENGGLYEDIYPGQMVATFNDWCFDEARKPGDTGIVETEYGCHIMFYVSDSETTYRDYLIKATLLSTDVENWYNALVEACTTVEGNTKYLSKNMVLSNG